MSEFKKPIHEIDTTRATAHLPNVDIEIVHRRAPDSDCEQILISMQAVPSFDAFGRFLRGANPFSFWAEFDSACLAVLGGRRPPRDAPTESEPHRCRHPAQRSGRVPRKNAEPQAFGEDFALPLRAGKRLIRDQAQDRLVEHPQYAVELMAAFDDQAGRGNHPVDALASRQARILLDTVDRNFGGGAED